MPSLSPPDFASLEILCLLPSIHLRLLGKHHVPLLLSHLILTLPSVFSLDSTSLSISPSSSHLHSSSKFSLPHLAFTSLALLHLSRFISRLWILPLLHLYLRFLILLSSSGSLARSLSASQHNPRCFAVARPSASFFEECLVIALRPVSTSLPGFRNESPRQLLASVLGRGLWLTSALTALGRQQFFCPSFLLPIYSLIQHFSLFPNFPSLLTKFSASPATTFAHFNYFPPLSTSDLLPSANTDCFLPRTEKDISCLLTGDLTPASRGNEQVSPYFRVSQRSFPLPWHLIFSLPTIDFHQRQKAEAAAATELHRGETTAIQRAFRGRG
jgi:hypothetical protein